MSATSELMAGGLPPQLARQLGQDVNDNVSAAGTTQATGTAIMPGLNFITTVAAGSGVTLPSATGSTETFVMNSGANVLTVYPATGEKINNNAANVGIQVAPNKAVDLCPSGARWIAILSA